MQTLREKAVWIFNMNNEQEKQDKISIPQSSQGEPDATKNENAQEEVMQTADSQNADIEKNKVFDQGSEKDLDHKQKRKTKSFFTKKKEEDSGFIEKVISINRITKVTKGGKKLSFSALVVVGDGKGHVGYSSEKAAEVSIAIQKSLRVAKKNMLKVSIRKGTIPHEIIGRCGGATVLLKPASEGTGVIASGPVRAICDASGIHNILTKCHRSNNPINVIKATVDGLTRLKPFRNQEKDEQGV